MANVNIKFNGKDFLLSCEDGQEDHLEELAANLNDKFEKLKNLLSKKLSSSNDHLEQITNILDEKSFLQR